MTCNGCVPCFYHALTARNNYVDCEGTARYPFGYGLSYTTFSILKPALDGNRVSATVTNTGKVKGDEVVQMYVRDVRFTVARPAYELKSFPWTEFTGSLKTPKTEKRLGIKMREWRNRNAAS